MSVDPSDLRNLARDWEDDPIDNGAKLYDAAYLAANEIERLQAEVKRLRITLREILLYPALADEPHVSADIAKQALEGEGER